jgi:hypothetical protein
MKKYFDLSKARICARISRLLGEIVQIPLAKWAK